MTNFSDMSDEDLAYMVNDWNAAALLRWNDFTENEKTSFRQMQDEAVKRFIDEKIGEELREG